MSNNNSHYDLRRTAKAKEGRFYSISLRCENCQAIGSFTEQWGTAITERRLRDCICNECGTYGFHKVEKY